MKESSYLTYPVESRDEAESLMQYLRGHGVEAEIEEPDAVICPLLKRKDLFIIPPLRHSWESWWAHHDSSQMGLRLAR